MEESKKKIFGKILNIYTIVGMVFVFAAIILILIPTAPYVVYRLNPSETENEVEKITQDLGDYDTTNVDTNTNTDEEENTEPEIDENLPKENYVVISSIGVYSPITESSDYTTALKKGAWIVPDFGTPDDNYLPIILAAHRFGYIYWDRDTRERISFYNLNKTTVGDTIQIIWGQRLYTYEIYSKEESTYISDYSADLILYTCKYFSSPQRIFVYANRVEE